LTNIVMHRFIHTFALPVSIGATTGTATAIEFELPEIPEGFFHGVHELGARHHGSQTTFIISVFITIVIYLVIGSVLKYLWRLFSEKSPRAAELLQITLGLTVLLCISFVILAVVVAVHNSYFMQQAGLAWRELPTHFSLLGSSQLSLIPTANAAPLHSSQQRTGPPPMYCGPGQPAARCIRCRERNGVQMKDNDTYFFDPKFKKELFANPRGLAAGMWKISEEKIKAGHRYYRFGDSNKSGSQNLSSPWWIDYETYKGIVLWGRDAGISDGYMGRLKLAIGYQNGSCDLVVSVTFATRLRAYTGPGRVIFGDPNEKGETAKNGMIWAPPQDVKQYFIPGMWDVELRAAVQRSPTIESALTATPVT
jgi:hypothetical protein